MSVEMTEGVVSVEITHGVVSVEMTDGVVSVEMTEGVVSVEMVSVEMTEGVVAGQDIPQNQLEMVLVTFPERFGTEPGPTPQCRQDAGAPRSISGNDEWGWFEVWQIAKPIGNGTYAD